MCIFRCFFALLTLLIVCCLESEKALCELDFLIRYESIFSEALSDPQSVLENLKKCEDIKEAEKQVRIRTLEDGTWLQFRKGG